MLHRIDSVETKQRKNTFSVHCLWGALFIIKEVKNEKVLSIILAVVMIVSSDVIENMSLQSENDNS